MPDHILNEFVRDIAMNMSKTKTQKSANQHCCQPFVRDPIFFQARNHSIQVAGEVMERHFTVAITDPGMPILLNPPNILLIRLQIRIYK